MILGAWVQRTYRVTARVLAVAGVLACTGSRASASEIGHFNPAMLSIRDYVMPDAGFYGALYNLWYTTDQLNGANGNAASSVTIPANHAPGRPSATLKLDVSVDLYALAPTFMWVSDWKPRPQGNTTSRRLVWPALVRSRSSRTTTSASASGPRRRSLVARGILSHTRALPSWRR